jgi:hypothetical protein
MSAFQTQTRMRFKATIFFALILLVMGAQAQVPEYTRHITRSFSISNTMTVDISNKYGKVQIIPWNVDSVKFSIDMRIRAKDKQKLEKLKQSVEFEFTPGQYYVLARTKFGDSSSDVFKDIVDIAGTYLSSNNSVTINYTVMVPAWVPLKIENKFGDVYLDDLEGSLNLVLSYGDLKANRLDGRSEIKLTSGDCDVGYLKDGQLYISYGNIHITESGKIIAQTRSSNVTIDKSENLKLDSRRDKVYLNDLNSFSGNSYFSSINITTLHNNMTFVSRYGDLSVSNIRRSFSLVNLSSEFTGLTLAFERPMAFKLDLIHHQDVLFMYPKSNASVKTAVFNAENKLFTTSGTIGAGTFDSEVVIKATRKCSVTISQK